MTEPGGGSTTGFIARLLVLGEERSGRREPRYRASLAQLRRGLGRLPGEAPGAYRELLALLGEQRSGEALESDVGAVDTTTAIDSMEESGPVAAAEER